MTNEFAPGGEVFRFIGRTVQYDKAQGGMAL